MKPDTGSDLSFARNGNAITDATTAGSTFPLCFQPSALPFS
jgi:hypothetical protein